MSPAQERFWNWSSPGKMLAIALLFCMPWINVRCDVPMSLAGAPEETGVAPQVLISQSGLQIAFGSFTDQAGVITKYDQALERMVKIHGAPPERGLELKQPVSWLMMGSLLAVFLATVTALLLPASRQRGQIVASLLVVALGLLVWQCVAGFPIDTLAGESDRNLQLLSARNQRLSAEQGTLPGLLPAGRFGTASHFTPWFHLTWILMLTTCCFSLVEAWLFKQAGKHPPSTLES